MKLQFWTRVKKLKYLRKYFLVFLIFVLVFVYGGNMNLVSFEQQQLIDMTFAQEKIASKIFESQMGENNLELNNILLVKKGQCGRLFFSLRRVLVKEGDNQVYSTKVILQNDFNQTQELGIFKVREDGFSDNHQINFCANFDSTDLLFVADQEKITSSFQVSSLEFYPLSMQKRDLANLKTTVEGSTDFSNIIFKSGVELNSATSSIRLTRKSQSVGQIIVLDSDQISYVDLKLSFIGSGGIGNYFLDLKEIVENDGKISLSSERVAYFTFNKDSANKKLKISDDVYRIPLAANVQKGKKYFVGINNESVDFNPLNTLKIFYGADNRSEAKVFSFIGKRSTQQAGSLFVKVYGANYLTNDANKILTGAKIIDNGDGAGQYFYSQKGRFSDYLDLEQNPSISDSGLIVYFDNVQSGIAAKDTDGNYFSYKINTLYPVKQIHLSATQINYFYTDSLMQFSFDGKTWQDVKADGVNLSDDGNKRLIASVDTDSNSKTVYVKFSPDKRVSNSQLGLFGIKNFEVSAILNLK